METGVFSGFIKNNQAGLRRLAGALVDADDIDDTVQDVWVAALRRPPPTDRPLRAWFVTVTRNLAKSRARAKRRRRMRDLRTLTHDHDAHNCEELVLRQEQLSVLATVVDGLEEPFRSTLLLHYSDGLELLEIARLQQVPHATVRWRVMRARQKLRKALDARYGEKRWHLGWVPLVGGHRARPARWTWLRFEVAAMLAAAIGAVVVVAHVTTRSPQGIPARSTAQGPATSLAQTSIAPSTMSAEVTVEDPDGSLLPDGRVVAMLRQPGATTQRPLTEFARTGTAHRATLSPGEWDLVATSPGFAPAFTSVRGQAGASTRARLRLSASPLHVTGRVTDRDGNPIASAIIVARDQHDLRTPWPHEVRVTTDASGRYRMDLAASAYELAVAYGGYAPSRGPLLLVGPETRDVVLDAGARVVGRAVDDRGAPLEGARCLAVTADAEQRVLQATRAGDDGRFSFAELPAGDVRVIVKRDVMVGTSGVVGAATAEVTNGGDVTARVAGTIEGVVHKNGSAIAGARVAVAEADAGWSFMDSTYTDGAGRFRVAGLWPGVHHLDVDTADGRASVFVRVVGNTTATIELMAGTPARPADTVLAGLATTAHGRPAAGAKVFAASTEGFRVVRADALGRWSLLAPTGTVDVMIAGDGDDLSASPRTVVEHGGSHPRGPVPVARSSRGTGDQVPIVSDRHIPNVQIDLRGGTPEAAAVLTIKRDGVATDRIRTTERSVALSLPAGRYDVTAVQPAQNGCAWGARSFVIGSAAPVHTSLDLQPGTVVTARVPADAVAAHEGLVATIAVARHTDVVDVGTDGVFVGACAPAGRASIAVRTKRQGDAIFAQAFEAAPGVTDLGTLGPKPVRRLLGIDVSPTAGGLVVRNIVPGSAGAEARIVPSDRIDSIDDRDVTAIDRGSLRELLASARTLRLGVVDSAGNRRTAIVDLGGEN